jgi:uncharacterized protein YycO
LIIFHSLSCSADQSADPVTSKSSVKQANTYPSFVLLEGDLLFADEDCGPFCDAIEKVTHGVNGASFSHVGMVIKNQRNRLVVLEAISKGVLETPVDSFLQRSSDVQGNPKVVVGRLKEDYHRLVPAAAQYVKERIGKAYDTAFDINNDQYYCSELLYYAFKTANDGTPIFQLRPMTFKDPDTKATFPIWVDYFHKLGIPIPENQPGLNPGSMSRSLYIDIVHAYGQPVGYRPR